MTDRENPTDRIKSEIVNKLYGDSVYGIARADREALANLIDELIDVKIEEALQKMQHSIRRASVGL